MKKVRNVAILGALALVALTGCETPPPEKPALSAGNDQYKLLMDYIAQKQFGKPLPRVKADKYFYSSYSEADRSRIRSEIARQFNAGKVKVLEHWVGFKYDVIKNEVDGLLASALVDAGTNGYAQCSKKFEQAREVVWQKSVGAELEGVKLPDIDAKVRGKALDYLDRTVNPRQWPVIEREMRFMADSYCVDSRFEEGIVAIRNYPLIRVYTSVLDARLDAVTAELVNLGVSADGLRPIAEIARKAMALAANLADNDDVVANEERDTVLENGNNPDTAKYRDMLNQYREALLLYGCTPSNTEKIVKSLTMSVNSLVEQMRKDPKYGKEFLKHIKRLGASAINKRIVALQQELVGVIEKNRKLRDEVLAPILKLQAKDIKKAMELAVNKLLKLDKNSEESKFLRPLLVNYITTKVNPELWASIEKEILAKTEEFRKAGKAVEGVAWLYEYPFVRTYAEEIDQRYADVKAEAVALGVPEDVASRYIEEIMLMTAPMDFLANFDDYYFERVTPAVPLTDKQLAKYEKALVACRKALVDNDCTAENADKLVKEIRDRFAPEFAKIGGETREQVLVLGACALNKRLEALKDVCVAKLVAGCAADYANQGKFDLARALVRDIALTGKVDFDLKVFAVRVGVLNSVVNPLQLISELDAINAKSKEFVEAGDYRGLLKWSEEYPGVHDFYAEVAKSVEAIRKAAIGIKVGERDADEYAEKLGERLCVLLEKRKGEYVPAESSPDLAELLKAVGSLEDAVLEQFHKRAFIERLHKTIPEEVLKMLHDVSPESLTTWELNERLRVRIAEIMSAFQIKELIARQEYLELLKKMDGEFSYDSQIAMAEDAIAKQLGVMCEKSHLLSNAVLGEYARAMRLLKLNSELSADQLTALVIGSVYLDQPAVFDHACRLGANVNAVTDRDPLRRSALLFAIQLGRVKFVHRLVGAGATVTVKDSKGSTAVHYAVRRGNLAVLNAMIAKNNVNDVNDDGQSALFDAARQNQPVLVEALIKAKADIGVVDKAGRTAADFACECGSRDVLDAFASAGAVFGPKQLAVAAAHDHLGVAQWLVTHGVDVNGEGVMAAARCGTDTKCYLIGEGGVSSACDCNVCMQKRLVKKSGSKTVETAADSKTTVGEAK